MRAAAHPRASGARGFALGRAARFSRRSALPGNAGDLHSRARLDTLYADSNEAFAHYVIAHEFAHAYLRNGGWNEITDREEAADALAASWGFRRPPLWAGLF
jgi:hypothetical protein